jgi:hypothetical protein
MITCSKRAALAEERRNGNTIDTCGRVAAVESVYYDMQVGDTTTQVFACERNNQPGSKHCALHSPHGTVDLGCTCLLVVNQKMRWVNVKTEGEVILKVYANSSAYELCSRWTVGAIWNPLWGQAR